MPLGPEIEKKPSVLEIKREIFETAGKRNPEQIRGLISATESILISEGERGRGKLRDTIDQIKESESGNEYFVDQNVAYLPERGSAVFIGDLHGDAEAVVSIVEQTRFIENMEEGDRSQRLVFLGDFADRGAKDVESLEMVLALKARYPDNVILLRGNHEEMSTGEKYGLKDSLNSRFGVEGLRLFGSYNKMFKELPAVCVTGNGIVAIHGGIPSAEIKSLRQLSDENTEWQMRWADPSEEIQNFGQNPMRGGTPMFGEKAFQRFMDMVGGKVMIRGHEYPKDGAETHFNGRLLTIFSNGGERSVSSAYKEQTRGRFFWTKLDGGPFEKLTPEMALEVDYRKPSYQEKGPEKEQQRDRTIELRNQSLLIEYRGQPIEIEIGGKRLQITKPEQIGLLPNPNRLYLLDPVNFREEWDVLDKGKPFILGRDNPSRFRLSEYVSGRHLGLSFDGQRIKIEDLNSTNGTKVFVREAAS